MLILLVKKDSVIEAQYCILLYIRYINERKRGRRALCMIDPSSHMITVISNYYGNKTVLLSFLEEGFVKRLENAIRFGSVVIIKDGEFFDRSSKVSFF